MMRRALRGALVLAGVVAWAPAPGAVPELPIADFVRKPKFVTAKISPTGAYLAVAMPYEDQTMLGILDLRNRTVSATLRFQHGEHVADFWWVGPDRVVTSIATRQGWLDQPKLTGEFHGMNVDGKKKKYLFGYRGGSSLAHARAWGWMKDPLPRDPLHALILFDPWYGSETGLPLVEKMNVYTGERTVVAALPGVPPVDAITDGVGAVRFVSSHGADGTPRLLTADGNSWAKVDFPEGAPAEIELHNATPDGSTLYLTTLDSDDRACLREYRTAAGFKDLQCGAAGALGAPILALEDRRPIGMISRHGPPATTFFDERHPDARFLQVLQRTFRGQRISLTSATLDHQSLVLLVESDRNPGDFYLVDRTTKKAEYITSRRSWIDPVTQAPMTPISYKTRDGAAIHGYLTAQDGLKAAAVPLVVMPHGGPHFVHDAWRWDPWPQLLANRGYAVLQVNYRGSSGYGRKHQEAGYGKWATLMQDDLTDAVRWAVASGIADPRRVCIFGVSYGGYAALMSAIREPELYRCAIGYAGAYDLVEHVSESDTAEFAFGRNYFKTVLGDQAALVEQSPVTHAHKLAIPVLIGHGTRDARVPFSEAKALRKVLDRHQKPYEWMQFRGEEHGFYDDKNHEAFLSKVLEFLGKHIGPSVAAAPGARPAAAPVDP